MRKLLIFLSCVLCFMLHVSWANAADFKSDYVVEYSPNIQSSDGSCRVKFLIIITNLRSDLYVKKVSLTFPKEFTLSNPDAQDNYGKIEMNFTNQDQKNTVNLDLGEQTIGIDKVNTIRFEFDQSKVFTQNGNIWEAILPTIDRSNITSYKVILNLPYGFSNKISLAKPKPTENLGQQIIWDNPTEKTIYAVFGSEQIYQLNFNYHLKNPKFVPVYTDIALPPDTVYQKNYLKSLKPSPQKVFQDEDGNWLARYLLKVKENLFVNYEGYVKISLKPRPEVMSADQKNIISQKSYLLSADSNWQIKNIDPYKNLKTSLDIYSYLVQNFSYNYQRLNNQDSSRFGAEKALKTKSAVCIDFSDSFVGLAREKGIYAREIQGYGYSQTSQLRPMSLNSDVLHSWSEYFDKSSQRWLVVDPTWENTSGIDYFHSFDFNHIAFVIHGRSSDYPIPAGMYKDEASKDLLIKPVAINLQEKSLVKTADLNIPNQLIDNKKYEFKFKLKNDGNVFLWNLDVNLKTSQIKVEPKSLVINSLAPLEEKEITLTIIPLTVKRKTKGTVNLYVQDQLMFRQDMIILPFFYQLALIVSIIILSLTVIVFLVKLFFSRKS